MKDAAAISHPSFQPGFSSAQARCRSMASIEPEKRLMLAVLGHAVEDFRTYAFVPTGRGRRLFIEVDAWFRSSAVGLFDFEGICEATGLDPDFIRQGLRSWYESAGCSRSECLHRGGAMNAAFPATAESMRAAACSSN